MEKTMGRQVRSGDWVKTLVLTAVVAAMACAATLAVQIPSPTCWGRICWGRAGARRQAPAVRRWRTS